MNPRIGIPWYRANIKQSVFDDAGLPRGFNLTLNRPKTNPIIPSMNYEPSMAYAPSMAYEPSMVIVPSPSTVLNPATQPSTVPNPATQPSTVPNPATQPSTVPNPATQPSTVPNPILPPLKQPEQSKNPALNPIPSYASMMDAQKEAQRQIINTKAYKEMIQIDMLMERNLAQRRSINKDAKISENSFIQYDKYVQQQTPINYNRLSMSKEVMDNQVKAFNQVMDNIEIKMGKGKDIMLDYIKKNEITFGTLPHHYKELNKEIAKAGLTGLAVGTIAYVLYQLAKVAIVL